MCNQSARSRIIRRNTQKKTFGSAGGEIVEERAKNFALSIGDGHSTNLEGTAGARDSGTPRRFLENQEARFARIEVDFRKSQATNRLRLAVPVPFWSGIRLRIRGFLYKNNRTEGKT